MRGKLEEGRADVGGKETGHVILVSSLGEVGEQEGLVLKNS